MLDGSPPEEIDALQHLARAQIPDFQGQLDALGAAIQRLQLLELKEAGRSHQLAELLSMALQLQETSEDDSCPVCKVGQLDEAWSSQARLQLEELKQQNQALRAAKEAVHQAERDIWGLVSGTCPAPELTVAWEQWLNTKNREGTMLLYHLSSPVMQDLRERLSILSQDAQARLREIGFDW